MNSTNNIFSLSRFGLLMKREFILRKSFIAYTTVAMLVVTIFVTLWAMNNGHSYKHWNTGRQMGLFITLSILFGILHIGAAFPSFRNNKKALDYILTPNSITEKYTFEFLFRIVLYPIIFLTIYWIGSNIAGMIGNSIFGDWHLVNNSTPAAYMKETYDLSYNFLTPFIELHNISDYKEAPIAAYTGILLGLSVPFTGAAFFSKSPLPKTALSLAILFAITITYVWFIDEILDIKFNLFSALDLSREATSNFISIFFAISTLVLHITVYLRIKEREV